MVVEAGLGMQRKLGQISQRGDNWVARDGTTLSRKLVAMTEAGFTKGTKHAIIPKE